LREGGRILITMIHPWVGFFSHPIRKRHDPDQLDRGVGEAEALGLTRKEMLKLLQDAGFEVIREQRFLWALNHLYIAQKRHPQSHRGTEIL
jgi:hypothetical protein